MNQLLNAISQFLRYTVKFLLLHFARLFSTLWSARDGIAWKHLSGDFISVVRSVGAFLVLNILALFVFIMLPQGRDILLIVAEEVGVETRFGNLLWLVIGVLLWSVVSEFSARYSIYVTDNSGKSLSHERVRWRKAVQHAISDLFLMLPFIVVLLGLLINYLNDDSLIPRQKNIGYGVSALIIYLLMNLVAMFYFDDYTIQGKLETIEDKGLGSLYRRVLVWIRDTKQSLRNKIGRRPNEKDWCDKLYGIYNDYIFMIRKDTNFVGHTRETYDVFTGSISAGSMEERDRFPQDPAKLEPNSLVPAEFQFKGYEADAPDNGLYKWIYRIPNKFYSRLHIQLGIVSGACLLLFVIICMMPIDGYERLGSPGLLMLAFACWTGIYLGLIFLDYAIFRTRYKKSFANTLKAMIPVRFLLLVALLLSSYTNDDHPLRYNEYGHYDHRPQLRDHFKAWAERRIKDTSYQSFRYAGDTCGFFPVVFVCAEGGALRTGAYTSILLSFLQDSLQYSKNIDLKRYIYAFSSVSGGSLGVSFFNTIAYLNKSEDFKVSNEGTRNAMLGKTEEYYNRDFLAPIIGKMFYTDLVNLFIPVYVENFDRAVALEKSWESGFSPLLNSSGYNYFSADFLSTYHGLYDQPALFINTTEVESGLQGWICNVKPGPDMSFATQRDILGKKIRGGINFSTAINFSTRFPLFSPAAMVRQNETCKWHYIDGGYVENTGAATMQEVLMSLQPVIKQLEDSNFIRIKPFVLMIRYANSDRNQHSNINFANELSEILNGFMNTRSGKVAMANDALTRYVEGPALQGKVSQLYLDMNGNQVPMNWVLSRQSLQNIEKSVKKSWENRKDNDLDKLFATNRYCTPFVRGMDTCNCYGMIKRPADTAAAFAMDSLKKKRAW